MLQLKKYAWFFILATGISLFVFSNICCNGKASNKTMKNNENNNSTISTDSKSGVVILDESTFDEKISNGVTLVDFWATWCRPCRRQGPIIEEVSGSMNGKVAVCKLDIDENPKIAQRYNVQSIPTMLIFKDGKVINQFMGVTAKEDIIQALNKILK